MLLREKIKRPDDRALEYRGICILKTVSYGLNSFHSGTPTAFARVDMLSMLMLFFPFSTSLTNDCETPHRSRISRWLIRAAFRASRKRLAKKSLSGLVCGLKLLRSSGIGIVWYCPPIGCPKQRIVRAYYSSIAQQKCCYATESDPPLTIKP